MNNVWVGTDLHLWSYENDRRHDFRSKKNLEELKHNYTTDIKPGDLFIYLGDLCDPGAADIDQLKDIISAIPGHKVMCRGNHDTETDAFYLDLGFDEICDVALVHSIALSHKPVNIAPDMINVHGHLHTEEISTLDYRYINAYDPKHRDHPFLLDELVDAAYKNKADRPMSPSTKQSIDLNVNVLDLSDRIQLVPMDESSDENTFLLRDLKDITTPDALSDWMRKYIRYSNFTRLKTEIQVIQTKSGSCHDQVAFAFPKLRKMGKKVHILFFISYKEGEKTGGMTHSLVYWEDDQKIHWLENSWQGAQGIHTFDSLDDLKKDIVARYKKMPTAQRFPELDFKITSITKFKPGITLAELVDSVYDNDADTVNETGDQIPDVDVYTNIDLSDDDMFRITHLVTVSRNELGLFGFNELSVIITDNEPSGPDVTPFPDLWCGTVALTAGRIMLYKYGPDRIRWDLVDYPKLIVALATFYMVEIASPGLEPALRRCYSVWTAPGCKAMFDAVGVRFTEQENTLFGVILGRCWTHGEDSITPWIMTQRSTADIITESIEPSVLDEIIFDDTEQAEYWLADDNYEPGHWKKEPMADGEGDTMNESISVKSNESLEIPVLMTQFKSKVDALIRRYGAPVDVSDIILVVHGKDSFINALAKACDYKREWAEDDVENKKVHGYVQPDNPCKVQILERKFAKDGFCRTYEELVMHECAHAVVNTFDKEHALTNNFQEGIAIYESGQLEYHIKDYQAHVRHPGRRDDPKWYPSIIQSAIQVKNIIKTKGYKHLVGMIKGSIDEPKYGEFLTEAVSFVQVPSVLYHGSPNKHAKLIAYTSPAYPDVKAVYATESYDFALAYAGGQWSDLQVNQSVYNGRHTLTEILPGMFDQFFNRKGYIHYVRGDDFTPHSRSHEFVCGHDVTPYRVDMIPNVLTALRRSQTDLYVYPNLPPFIPDRIAYIRGICERWGQDADKILKQYSLNESASFASVKQIVDRIPQSEHHFFYHGDTFKDSPNVVYRNVTKERRRNGGAAFIDIYAFDDAPTVGVVVIAATPEARGKGLTDYLISTACAELPKKGITKLVWRCDTDNLPSYKLAMRHGFVDVSKPGTNQYRLEKNLGAGKNRFPNIVAKAVPSTNPNDGLSSTAIDITFFDEKQKIGEASASAIDTDSAFLYNVEVFSKFRGKGYANSIMQYMLTVYPITDLTVEKNNKVAIELYKKFGFKPEKQFTEHGEQMLFMRRDKSQPCAAIAEAAAETHPMDRDEQNKMAAKYGLNMPGHTPEEQESKKSDAQLRAEERAKQRKKNLEKARRVKKRKTFIRHIKSKLPLPKNEAAEGADDQADYYDGPEWEKNAFGDYVHFFKDVNDMPNENHVIDIADKNLRFLTPLTEATTADDKKLYPVYIMLVHSGTLLANAIKAVTNSKFSHSSISFDSSMHNMYSFGRKFDTNPIVGAFKKEDIRDDFFKNRQISYALYVVPCTANEIAQMKHRLEYFVQNSTKFRYDFIGLFKNYLGIADNPEYRWFCSRFVADIINAGAPSGKPYVVEPSLMKPEDFRDTNFARYVIGGMLDTYDAKLVDRLTNKILRAERIRREKERQLDLNPMDPMQESMLGYHLAMLDESAVDDFLAYLGSFKIKFDKAGNVIITRREYDQLDMHFRHSLKMIKAYEKADNLNGVKDELCKIKYMIELINQHYLSQRAKSSDRVRADMRKEMMDLRSVMLNAFQQHLKYVTIRDPQFNLQQYYNASDYGKDTKIPATVLSTIGKTVITKLS